MDWQRDRSMSPEQYAWTLKRLGMNKSQAARYLGLTVRTSQRYYDGTTLVPVATALLLRALIFYNITPAVPHLRD